MVKKLDDSIGAIVEALADKEILHNTIIVFVSDNGGMTSGIPFPNYASNYPLRGIKMTPFEGGLRVAGLIWSACLNNTSHYWDGYMHVADWLPTLLSAAGVEAPSDIDGINQWDSINANSASERTEMYEIDDVAGYASIIYGDYKLITGTVNRNFSTHQGSDITGIIGKTPSYVESIFDSKVYCALDSYGFTFNINDLSLRNNTTINCKDLTSTTICYPSKGKQLGYIQNLRIVL